MSLKKIYFKLFKSHDDYSDLKSEIEKEKKVNLFNSKYESILNEIFKAVNSKKELNFLHSGHCGDLIYSLAIIQKISKTRKCNLYIGVNKKLNTGYKNHPAKNVYINRKMFEMILPLLETQKYLNNVKEHENENIDVNLDLFRELPVSLLFNSPRWYFHITGEHVDLSEPYLYVNDHKHLKNKIIIHRTFRYRNDFINYKFLKEYEDIFFVGLQNEFEDLKLQIPNMKLYDIKNFLEMAEIIKSAKIFIGNLSVGYPIAEALKTPRLLEACPHFPVVQPVGKNGYDFYYQAHFEKWFRYLLKIN